MKRDFKIIYTCPALFGKQEFLCRAAAAEDALTMFRKEVVDWVKITQIVESYKDAKGNNIESGYDVSFKNYELKK